MNRKFQFLAICVYIIIYPSSAVEKWSRQLEATGPGSETYDWIPVAQPIDAKDRTGRVITYQQNFPPNGPFGEIQKHHHVPSPQQVQPFGFPFHFQRFQQPQTQPLSSQPLLSQPQSNQQQPVQQQKLNLQPQQPTSQSFFKFEMPFNRDGNRNQDNSQGVQTGYQIQHSAFGAQQPLFQTPLLTQKQFFPPEFHPLQRPQQSHQQQQQQAKPVQQNFIEEPVKTFREPNPISSQTNLGSTVSPSPSFPVQQAFELQKPASFQSQLPFHTSAIANTAPSTNIQQDKEVQLLYVPYDTLYNQQRNENPTFENSRYNIAPHQQVNPYQINNFYMPETHIPNTYTTSTTAKPTTTTFKPSTQFQNFLNPQYSTPKPKPKAHQPPLAMFLFKSSNYPTQVDVVNALKNSKTIAVLDAPSQQAPPVFVGPAGMQTPSGYAKFELPYLSQLAQTSNIADVSFFVAPLSYRTPAGFNKILLPEPHVGSIVINKQKDTYNDLKSTNQQSSPTVSQVDIYNHGKYASQLPSTSQNENYSGVRDLTPTSTLPPQRNTLSGIRDFNQPSSNQHIFITPNQNEIQEIPSTTPRIRPQTTQKVKSTTPKEYFPEIVREVPKLNRHRFPYEFTTQRQPMNSYRGNKYSGISTNKNVNPEPIQEVTSPKIYKQERVKPTFQVKRPESQYAQFRPIPNNIPAEDFYKVQPLRTSPPTTSSSSSTSPSTTTSTSPPRTYFTQSYPTSPQISFQSTRGQVYHNNDEATRTPASQQSGNGGVDLFTTRPLQQQSQSSEEEYRMKQYFRQQDAFRNRPSFHTTTPDPAVENIPYTPISVDYDREVRIPSSTPKYMSTTTQRPTTQRQRVTFYHPMPTTSLYEENSNTVPASEQVLEFARDRDIQTTTTPRQEIVIEQSERTTIPENHNPIHSKLKNNHNEFSTTEVSDVEYEPNPYQLPSELPPLTPNLPGLVNGLIEKNKLEGGETETTIQMESTTVSTPDTRPTRRLINRIKKPIVSKVSQSVSYSSSDYSTRRPINRIRRPYTGRNYTTSSTSTTTRPSTSRTSIIRNPNRIRYNPTPEERQTLRLKSKKHGSRGKNEDNSDDLEYQRDVLKQNYPVFKPSTKKTTTEQPSSQSTEKSISEQQQIYTVTPASEQNFDRLIEPMQIAQQYQEYPQNNYGPGYFPNEEEIVPTEAVLRNEISPVYTASSTTEEPQPTTRRSPFIRRGPRIKTTTETPIAPTNPTTEASEERFTIRTRAPPRRVVKVRARTRRPHPASSTATPSEDIPESESEKKNYNKLNRFNQELYQDEITQRRQRIKSQFHLEPQESQWSPSLSGKSVNSFQPLKEKDHLTITKNYENEPEIVTASIDIEKSDSYVFNVSAGFGPTASTHFTSKSMNDNSINPSKKSEKSFADLLEEVMSDIGKESDMKSPDTSYFESQKTDSHPNRRGKWKNSNTGESFETAESQNIGSQFFNSLYTGTIEKATESLLQLEDMYATTPSREEMFTTSTTPSPLIETESMHDNIEEMSTPKRVTTTDRSTTEQITSSVDDLSVDNNQPESITRRVDDLWNVEDLDGQPSMFSEVRKQLNELFKAEEDDSVADQSNVEYILPHKHEYTNIQRLRTTPEKNENIDDSVTKETIQGTDANMFHQNLMESVVYATSTSGTDDISETEICYRGHCIRSEDLPPNHKLH